MTEFVVTIIAGIIFLAVYVTRKTVIRRPVAVRIDEKTPGARSDLR